ncbi:MAG: hypothetical protein M3Y56_09900 [Armatimonadota bacterium]|nr:hypothetical protein [Armatimonadota bacterium]
MASSRPIGEIVEASLGSFTAETPPERLYDAPPFGSIVRAEDPDSAHTLYAVVAATETSSVEANRRAAAFWQSEDELRKNQPQIFELLSTRFVGLLIGYREGSELRLRLPPRPPRVHGFVYECEPNEVRQVTADLNILRPLLAAPVPSSDELVAAVIREGAATREDGRSFFVAAGKQLASLLRDDYPRLQAIIGKLV